MIESFLIAVLATYRLTLLIVEDDGPLFVFKRIRSFTTTKSVSENDEYGIWANIDEGINCAYCVGLYMAVLIGMLMTWQNYFSNLILLIFAIAGGQSLLKRLGEK